MTGNVAPSGTVGTATAFSAGRRVAMGTCLFAIPVLISLLLAFVIANQELHQKAGGLAGVALHRAAQITDQIAQAFTDMHTLAPVARCSADAIAFMRSVDLGSSLLQGVGYIRQNTLQCSSLGSVATFVGPPDYVSATQTRFRHDRTLAEARRTPLLMVSDQDGFTALVHPSLLFSLDNDDASVPEGIVSYSQRLPIVTRGSLLFDWSSRDLDPGATEGFFNEAGLLVGWKRSPVWDHFAYAAVPEAGLFDGLLSIGRFLLPLGVIAGVLSLMGGRKLEAARTGLPSLVREGLRRGEFSVVYQPIVELASGRWVGAEVLARWQRPSGEWVSPDLFVAIAEQHGLIRSLTDTVLKQCTEDFTRVLHAHPGIFLSVNVSSFDLADDDFPMVLTRLCKRSGIEPQRLHLEVTERAEISLEKEVDGIRTLRGLGFPIGIDDFGVGYSNLAYFDKLGLDYIKIDRVFVANALHGNLGAGIVEHIIAMAAEQHLHVIAEGIEHEEQRLALMQRGVTNGQGWLFAHAMQLAEFEDGLKELTSTRSVAL